MKPYSFIILLMVLVFACRNKEKPENTDTRFCINDSLMKQVKIDTAQLQEVINEIRLTGKITFNDDKVVKVFPFAGGVVEDLKVELGDFVTKGQILALIRSSEIVDFENQLNAAKSNLDVSKKNLQVAEDMYKGDLTSEKEYITAKYELQKAQGEFEKIKKILSIYGEGNENSIYALKAPISGYVVEKNVTENTQFRPDNTENLFTISNLENLWAIGNVYESDISKIKIGQEATVTTMSYPDKPFKGRIDKIFNVLDADTRVEKVKVKISNYDNVLKPEMFAYIKVNYPEGKQLLCISSDAVIFNYNKNFVVVYKSACDLEIREIQIYKNIKGVTFINKGLSDGEKVLSDSQLLIYNALNK